MNGPIWPARLPFSWAVLVLSVGLYHWIWPAAGSVLPSAIWTQMPLPHIRSPRTTATSLLLALRQPPHPDVTRRHTSGRSNTATALSGFAAPSPREPQHHPLPGTLDQLSLDTLAEARRSVNCN